MTSDRLAKLCEVKFGTPMEVFDFSAKTAEKTVSGQILTSWPRNLLRTFETRLRGSIEHGADSDLLREVEGFVRHLPSMPEDATLWVWQARSPDATFSGWADEN